MPVRLGYACINTELRDNGILENGKKRSVFCSRSVTLKTYRDKGPDIAIEKAMENIRDLKIILEYNEKLGVRFFRITSNLFPHYGNPKISNYSIDFADDLLRDIGEYARRMNHRLTFHPGQYVQLGSHNASVVKQSIEELRIHADIFRRMGLEPHMGSVMIIHGGGHYGDRHISLGRLKSTLSYMKIEMPYIFKYISLENDEIYSVSDILPICEELNIPLTPDYFHDTINSISYVTGRPMDIYSLTERILNTWRVRNIKPKCHLSGQKKGARRGAHSNCIDSIPKKLLNLCSANDMDIMLETKDKEKCVIEMLHKHFKLRNGDWILVGR